MKRGGASNSGDGSIIRSDRIVRWPIKRQPNLSPNGDMNSGYKRPHPKPVSGNVSGGRSKRPHPKPVSGNVSGGRSLAGELYAKTGYFSGSRSACLASCCTVTISTSRSSRPAQKCASSHAMRSAVLGLPWPASTGSDKARGRSCDDGILTRCRLLSRIASRPASAFGTPSRSVVRRANNSYILSFSPVLLLM
jgi:hypothetical protein